MDLCEHQALGWLLVSAARDLGHETLSAGEAPRYAVHAELERKKTHLSLAGLCSRPRP